VLIWGGNRKEELRVCIGIITAYNIKMDFR